MKKEIIKASIVILMAVLGFIVAVKVLLPDFDKPEYKEHPLFRAGYSEGYEIGKKDGELKPPEVIWQNKYFYENKDLWHCALITEQYLKENPKAPCYDFGRNGIDVIYTEFPY